MGRFTEEHINFLKEMISKGKEKYQPEWEKIKKPLMDAMREFREKLFQIFKEESEEHIKKKTWEKEENKFYEIVRELKLGEIFIFAVDYDKETWEKIKNLFEEIKNLPPRKEEMYGILEKLVKNKNENKIVGSTTYWTILLSVFYPEWYFPADNNVLGEKIRNKINIQEFWGGAANPNTIKDGKELYNILYDIKQSLGIETMSELGFYLYKYAKEKPSLEPTGAQNKNTSLSSIINAINTKPFLILAGISGTGKTQIARLIASVMSEEEIIAETMSEEEIKEIIKNIMNVIEKPNRKNIKKARSSYTLKFFLSVIENLKKEKWSGIEKVKEKLNKYLDLKRKRVSEAQPRIKVNVEYNKKFVFDTLQLPFTGEKRKSDEPREAVDYLIFKWKKCTNAWFGVIILKKKKEKNIRIGFYSYANDKGIKEFNDKMKELNLYEEMDLEISETFPQKVARKMEELLEKGIKNQKDIEEVCNKLFGQEKKT